MTGRGIDQVLPHPCDPTLHENYVASAKDYVGLAEQANGPIPRHAGPAYVWGAALDELDRMRPDGRIINLETADAVEKVFLNHGAQILRAVGASIRKFLGGVIIR